MYKMMSHGKTWNLIQKVETISEVLRFAYLLSLKETYVLPFYHYIHSLKE